MQRALTRLIRAPLTRPAVPLLHWRNLPAAATRPRPSALLDTASHRSLSSSSSAGAMSSSPSPPPSRRGVFILLEGLDRSGKSSQCKQLAESLNAEQPDAALAMRFPDRTTAIGKMLDAYLRQSAELDDHAVHLLFSANRWESHGTMVSSLQSGRHLVVDRYAYSGIAFTSSKVGVRGLDLDWTTSPDRGLLAPDLVIFLDITNEEAAKRGGFGEERYEKREIQDRVRGIFESLRQQASGTTNTAAVTDGNEAGAASTPSGASFGAGVEWRVVNAGQSQAAVHEEILALAKEAIAKSATAPIRYL